MALLVHPMRAISFNFALMWEMRYEIRNLWTVYYTVSLDMYSIPLTPLKLGVSQNVSIQIFTLR